jgi:hypothetical protein
MTSEEYLRRSVEQNIKWITSDLTKNKTFFGNVKERNAKTALHALGLLKSDVEFYFSLKNIEDKSKETP